MIMSFPLPFFVCFCAIEMQCVTCEIIFRTLSNKHRGGLQDVRCAVQCIKILYYHLINPLKGWDSSNILEHHLLTYLLTPWCSVLLEKLTGLQLAKKFHEFHGTRKIITALTSVHHLSLSWASPIQSIYPHPTSWRSILILSINLRLGLPSGLPFPPVSLTNQISWEN